MTSSVIWFGSYIVFFFLKQNGCRITWQMTSWFFFFCGPFYPEMTQKFSYWSDVAFYICNYDVITRAPIMSFKKTHIPHEECFACAKFQFFPCCGFRDTEVQSFSVFPTWLPDHVTFEVIGHVVWQPCWKNKTTLDLRISEKAPRKNWNLANRKYYSCGMSEIFFLTS